MSDDEISRRCAEGRTAIESAKAEFRRLDLRPPVIAAITVHVDAGRLDEAVAELDRLSVDAHAAIEALQTADRLRTGAWELAARAYSPRLSQRARAFGAPYDGARVLDDTWDRVRLRMFTWRADGPFYAWLSVVFQRALQSHIRSVGKEVAAYQTQILSGQIDPASPIDGHGDGTTTIGLKFSFKAFKESLSPKKNQIWEAWVELIEDGMSHEQAYTQIAGTTGYSYNQVKSTIIRIQSEFKRLCGGPVLSGLLVIWVVSVTSGGGSALLATGSDIHDNLRVIVTRPVKKLDVKTFTRMFKTLKKWHLPVDEPLLVVVDGSPGLFEATKEALPRAVVQPCLPSLAHRVAAECPVQKRAQIEKQILAAYRRRRYVRDARPALRKLMKALAKGSPKAAELWAADLDSSLAVERLNLPRDFEIEATQVKCVSDSVGMSSPLQLVGRSFAEFRKRRRAVARKRGLEALANALAKQAEEPVVQR